ncbi:MAG: hypothetical protein E4H14_03710 [Candidatus Thorarchaeota archaeon]|nr:MAG: hypothetical protein E4H14_03710 [Candidatus Thorarchaeota archaeon]
MARAYKERRLHFRIFLCALSVGLILGLFLAVTGEDPTIILVTLGPLLLLFPVFYCTTPNLKFLPGPKRDILAEFTNIVEQDVIISGFRDDSAKGFRYDYDIKSINMIRGQLRLDIAGDDWKSIRRKFTIAVRDVFGTQWYAENSFLLKVLELEEYLGYEGLILDILKGIKSCARIEELEQQVISQLIPKLRDQIKSGGNTTFLDVDKMKDQESARLVPLILEKRREHFLSAMDKYRASEREVDDLLDVLGTNYGCKVAKAIKKEMGSPKAAGYIVTKLNSVYETLTENQRENISPTIKRLATSWIHLCREIAMSHIAHLIDAKLEVPFQYCNPNFGTLYESGYRDIFKDLKRMKSYPKLYKGEYKFILKVLKGIKTDRALDTLELLKMNDWKDKYLQS